ncbi:MAG: hypothetical protein H0U74_17335 [Bradymonadaceae bacterium]|nr:hypothetical protein [Lujinxingiaceae bacterium]
MDPVTIIIITLFVLATGGGASAAATWRRSHQREALQKAVLTKRAIAGQPLAVFDVFWDLGVSDYALEIMGHQGLLPTGAQELERALGNLEDLVRQHGSYNEYVADTLSAIQEFFDEHRRAGNRRALPTLELRAQKLLPLPQQTGALLAQPASQALARRAPADEAPLQTIARELGQLLQTSLDERQRLREHRAPTSTGGLVLPGFDQASGEVDLDKITSVDVGGVLQMLFAGNLADGVQKWWKMRRLRGLKGELDTCLASFYGFYADTATGNPAFYHHLYDGQRRWAEEAARIDALRRERPWAARSWGVCADVLIDHALLTANALAYQAGANVYNAIERIHDFARNGNVAMAGYLIYLNQHAFFAGRAPNYVDHTRQIEVATYRVQEELRKLRQGGVL